MKKRYLIFAGVLTVALAAAGCGNKDESEQTDTQAQVSATPAASAESGEIVDMQKASDASADITNIIGTKSATASQLIVVNDMGGEISGFYVREYSADNDDDEWGDELIQGEFALADTEKALYYYEKDSDAAASTTYDIRVTFSEEDRSDCFFRNLPMLNMTQITLCMDGEGEDGIPYASYLTGSSKTPVSTLQEVKQRLGLDDEDSSDSEDSDSEDTDSDSDSSEGTTPTAAPQPTQAPADDTPGVTDTPSDEEPTDVASDQAKVAEGYIGQSLDALIGACGEPTGSDYENEPETGETGYHYYDTFTVSTTVDDQGNEVVAGVW